MFKEWEGKKDMTPEEVLAQWKTVIKRGVGIKRATQLVEKARKSVGIKIGIRFARKEIHDFLD